MQPTLESKLQHEARQRTWRLLDLASRRFGANLLRPEIRFDLKGKAAGQVRTTSGHHCVVRYNSSLLQRYSQEFLKRTVPHESAHVVTFHLFGPGVQPHGREWHAIMKLFGAPPDRCHNYDVRGMEVRRLRRYQYRCECRTHQLTSIRHNRIGSGQVYLCRQCGSPLKLVPEASG